MVDTALDLITNVLLDLGVLADEETPTASQAVGGLRKLNNLIDSWNIEGLMVYGAIQNVFPLVNNQSTYTLGTGGNFNIPRPNEVISAYVRDTTLPASLRFDIPVQMLNVQEYADFSLKGLNGIFPQGIYIDDTFPLSTVYLVGIPNTSQYSLVLWTSGIISNLALNTLIQLSPGYTRALEANLAIDLAPSYGVEVTADGKQIAQSSKAMLKIKNFDLNELEIDQRLERPYFNIYTG